MWYIIAGLVLALGVFSALAVRMGFSPRRVLQMARVGAHEAMPVVVILLTIGMVNEMFIEKDNDDYEYETKATQNDMDMF